MAISYAVLLITEFGAGQGSCSSQIVGTLGQELTLLCLGNEPTWITPRGMRNSNNITFACLSSSDAGVYTCRGTVQDQEISSSASLKISRCNAVVYVLTGSSRIVIGQNYGIICNTSQLLESSCIEEEFYIFNGSGLISRNKHTLLEADSVSNILNNFYSCIVTLNGSNFTSNPVRIQNMIELSDPLSVNVSSNVGNPVPPGSSPTLSCVISLSPAIDIEVEVIVRWSGQTFGLNEYTTTESVLKSNADVPTYASTATLNASGTFYDSGQYFCSVVINPLNNRDIIQGTSAVDSPEISVLFSYPRRPILHSIHQRDLSHNWIYLSWDYNQLSDINVTEYEVEYSYVGECSEINQNIITVVVGRSNSSFNITGLGEYLNYNITLTAINDAGRSPPNMIFAVTLPSIPTEAPQEFLAAMTFSTNITVQWQRVRCSERNSEITHYILQYSLEDSDMVTEERVVQGTRDEDRMYTANRLQLLSEYTFTIAAVNSGGQRGPNTTITVTTSAPESVAFQIQLSGVHSCLQWRISDPEDKIHDVLVGIANGVNQQCPPCELEHTNITNGEFQCFPGSPNQVTFRAKVHDRAQATAREIITHIEQWITSSDVVTLPVHHARLKINSTCVVLLASLDDPECRGYLTPPSQPTVTGTASKMTSSGSFSELITTEQLTTDITGSKRGTVSSVVTNQPQLDAGAIVGGAVAIVLIICVTIGVVILLCLLYSIFKMKHIQTKEQSVLKKPAESKSEHDIIVPVKTAAAPAGIKVEEECTEPQDETYEVIELKATSSGKARHVSAQIPQEDSAETQPVETEASKNSAEEGDNQEAYVTIMNVD